jgi:hypothetical protein
MTRIATSIRAIVITRARYSCEYCHLHVDYGALVHEIDHVVAQKHGGPTELNNLAYACAQCNRLKGSNIASTDPLTGQIITLFNPRIDQWDEHFKHDGPTIIPLTAAGRATERVLQLNQVDRILLRKELISTGRYPYQLGS